MSNTSHIRPFYARWCLRSAWQPVQMYSSSRTLVVTLTYPRLTPAQPWGGGEKGDVLWFASMTGLDARSCDICYRSDRALLSFKRVCKQPRRTDISYTKHSTSVRMSGYVSIETRYVLRDASRAKRWLTNGCSAPQRSSNEDWASSVISGGKGRRLRLHCLSGEMLFSANSSDTSVIQSW